MEFEREIKGKRMRFKGNRTTVYAGKYVGDARIPYDLVPIGGEDYPERIELYLHKADPVLYDGSWYDEETDTEHDVKCILKFSEDLSLSTENHNDLVIPRPDELTCFEYSAEEKGGTIVITVNKASLRLCRPS